MALNPNDVAILTFPGATQHFITEVHKVIQDAIGSDGGVVLVTNEEIKVMDLTRLEDQLRQLLSLVQQINKARGDDL